MDVSSKSKNKVCALDTCNRFAFVVSHLAEDNIIFNVLLNAILQRERNFADRQISSKSI